MRKKGFLAALLALAIILSIVLCACADSGKKAETTAQKQQEAVTTGDPRYTAELDGCSYNGTEIRMLVDNYKYSTDEFYAETENGAVVNDTVLKRNMRVEETLGVKLNITRVDTTSDTAVGNEMERSIKAGDNLYDIVTIPGYRATQYNTGNFYNLKNVKNLNLEKLYWTQGFNEVMCAKGKQYLASGAYSISMLRGMYVTIFNKDLVGNLHLDDPYELVKNGQWTIEKMTEMVKGCYTDLNGDMKRDYDDMYGFVSGCYTTSDPYWVSWNMKFLTLDADGNYVINYDGEKFADIINTFHEIMFNNDGAYCVSTTYKDANGKNTAESIALQFSQGNTVFATIEVNGIERQVVPSEFKGNFGIVPIPKYNSDQEGYYTHTSDRLTTMAICSSVAAADLPMMGAVMECLAASSYEMVFPAYYDVSLSYRFLQDSNSTVMLDTIYSGIKIEGAFLYCKYFNMLSDFRKLFASGNAVASSMTSKKGIWDNGAKALNSMFDAAEG